jgi:hypothetical protein
LRPWVVGNALSQRPRLFEAGGSGATGTRNAPGAHERFYPDLWVPSRRVLQARGSSARDSWSLWDLPGVSSQGLIGGKELWVLEGAVMMSLPPAPVRMAAKDSSRAVLKARLEAPVVHAPRLSSRALAG